MEKDSGDAATATRLQPKGHWLLPVRSAATLSVPDELGMMMALCLLEPSDPLMSLRQFCQMCSSDYQLNLEKWALLKKNPDFPNLKHASNLHVHVWQILHDGRGRNEISYDLPWLQTPQRLLGTRWVWDWLAGVLRVLCSILSQLSRRENAALRSPCPNPVPMLMVGCGCACSITPRTTTHTHTRVRKDLKW